MEYLYVVIEEDTGLNPLDRAYTSKRGAKLALKSRIYRERWSKHVIVAVEYRPTLSSMLDADGKWTEVTANER